MHPSIKAFKWFRDAHGCDYGALVRSLGYAPHHYRLCENMVRQKGYPHARRRQLDYSHYARICWILALRGMHSRWEHVGLPQPQSQPLSKCVVRTAVP